MKCLLKTMSWLIVSGILIAVCAYAETGSVKVAVTSALWACILKTPIYWAHEILWSKVSGATVNHVSPDVVCVACEQAMKAP